jgi:hypothetical protein
MTAAASELATREDLSVSTALSTAGWVPKTLDDLKQICSWVAKSRIAPPGFDSPEKVFIGLQTAMEAGLPMLSGLRMLYIVHNVPSWLGKGVLALIRSKGVCKMPPELSFSGEGDARAATWKFQRKDMPKAISVTYTWADAKRAGLDKKSGAWQTNPDDMMSWRAASRMGDRYFSDILLGLDIYEVVRDLPPEAFEHVAPPQPASIAAPDVADPLMVGVGEPAQPGQQVPQAGGTEAPAPTSTEEPPDLEDGGEMTMVECPRCKQLYVEGASVCPACGLELQVEGAEQEPEPEEKEPPVDLPTLRKMLKRVGVTVAGKVSSAWSNAQQIEAYNWAFDEQYAIDAVEAKVGYDRQVPEKPDFLPAIKRAAAPADTPPAAAAEPDPAGEPSPYSTPGGVCITARQAGALRGMAQNRCVELGLTEGDARHTLLAEALGCDTGRVTEDMYEAAKVAVKEHEVGA